MTYTLYTSYKDVPITITQNDLGKYEYSCPIGLHGSAVGFGFATEEDALRAVKKEIDELESQ